MNIQKPIHLAGVAGSAMSGLALLLRQRGYQVVGTDPQANALRDRLEAAGVEVYVEQDGSRIPSQASLLVTTAALSPDHPELKAAKAKGIPVVTYAQFLGALMAESKGVGVAGTHGKTTTTSMIVSCLKSAGIDPGFVIGGYVPELGTNADSGASPIFVAEACEYNRSFLDLRPSIAVITNIEADHLDIYADLDDIKNAFFTFASRLAPDEVLIYSAQCQNTASIIQDLKCEKCSFGVETDAVFSAWDVHVGPEKTEFELLYKGSQAGKIQLSPPGRHNVANALAAIAVCHTLNLGFEQISESLAVFKGVNRRFDIRGKAGGVVVVDDYAHHPTEIRALLNAAKERFPGRRLVVAFQPHQSSRTQFLMDEFAGAFSQADLVFLPDIYSVRDTPTQQKSICSTDLVDRMVANGVDAQYIGALDTAVDILEKTLKKGDVFFTVGAGNINQIVDSLLTRLSATQIT